MKKINLQRLSNILSEKEMKNVLGGSGGSNCNSSNFCDDLICLIQHNPHILSNHGTCVGAAYSLQLCGWSFDPSSCPP